MPLLTVRCRRDPFAVVEVRDQFYEAVGVGTGEVVVDASAGTYDVIVAAAGREEVRTVEMAGANVVVEVRLGGYPSAAPTYRSSTNVDAHGAATLSLSERLVALAAGAAATGIILRRPAGVGAGALPRRPDGTLPVELGDDRHAIGLSWTAGFDPSGGEYATAGAVVEPGARVVTIGDDPATSLVVPAWEGWQTLLFLPVTPQGIATSMAVMHVVPVGAPWRPTLPLAELLDHLHWAMVERPPITDECLVALRREADGHFSSSPLLHLLLGNLASTSGGEVAAAEVRESLRRLSDPEVAAVVPSDIVALRLSVTAPSDSASLPTSATPLLARSADVLMDHESRALGGIGGAAVDAMATRLASPLWFLWSPVHDVPMEPRISSFVDESWRQELSSAASAMLTLQSLDRVAHGSDPSVARLVAYLHDESQRRRTSPGDVLVEAHPIEVIRGSGLPAIGALRALHVIGAAGPPVDDPASRPKHPDNRGLKPPKWQRSLLGFVVAVLLGAAALLVLRAVDEEDTPAATTSVTVSNSSAERPVPITGAATAPTTSQGTAPPTPPATTVVEEVPDVKAAPSSADEEDGSLNVVVSLTGTARRPVVVDVTTDAGTIPGQSATPGEDFAPPATPLTFDVGTLEQEFDIELIDDDLPENDEAFTLRLAVRSDGPAVPVEYEVVISDGTDAVVDPPTTTSPGPDTGVD